MPRRVRVTRFVYWKGYGFATDAQGTVYVHVKHYAPVTSDNDCIKWGNSRIGDSPLEGDDLVVEDVVLTPGFQVPCATKWCTWKEYATLKGGEQLVAPSLSSLAQLDSALRGEQLISNEGGTSRRNAHERAGGSSPTPEPPPSPFVHGKVTQVSGTRGPCVVTLSNGRFVQAPFDRYGDLCPDEDHEGKVRFCSGKRLREPQLGDELYLETPLHRGSGTTVTALFWTFYEVYRKAVAALTGVEPTATALPAPQAAPVLVSVPVKPVSVVPTPPTPPVSPSQVYRVRELRSTTLSDGATLQELLTQFPNGALKEHRLGPHLHTRFVFEVQEGNIWKEVPDPRTKASETH